jgi:SAM-dependent methyltransferase
VYAARARPVRGDVDAGEHRHHDREGPALATTTTPPTTPTVTGTGATDTVPFDEARRAAFEDRLVDVLNGASLGLMISVGHRTGLFDAMAELGPSTPAALADHAGLRERYVTEWLGAMTAGRVVDHDPVAKTYLLPPEHVPPLTRASDAENLAVYLQYIPLLGAVEDEIVRCFREGGGVDYAAYPRFHDIMEEESVQTVLAALPDILGLVPGLTDRLERGIHAIDVGCGRGRALLELASWYPNSTFVGYDLSEDAVRYATELAAARGLDNVRFEARDAARLEEALAPDSVDAAFTFDAVHDQADPDAAVRGIRHALRGDGVYVAQDIDATSSHHGDLDHPLGPYLYTISTLHCMTVSLARDGRGLGAMWGRERAQELFRAAGFGEVAVETLPHDEQNAYFVSRP